MSDTHTPDAGPAAPITLAIDIGGTGLKAARLDRAGQVIGTNLRISTPHPSPPAVVVPALAGMANSLGPFDRISVGFPGVVKAGKILTAPNLGTGEWAGYDLGAALHQLLGAPVRVENDASVQGLGVITGTGIECVITLGTGFGYALYQDGRLAPHLELSQHVIRGKKTYDQYLGVAALEQVGKRRWNRRVERMLYQLRILVNFDHLYIGGGDSTKLTISLPANVTIVPNSAGLTGGVHLWNEVNRT